MEAGLSPLLLGEGLFNCKRIKKSAAGGLRIGLQWIVYNNMVYKDYYMI
jgi:hypothetical protein